MERWPGVGEEGLYATHHAYKINNDIIMVTYLDAVCRGVSPGKSPSLTVAFFGSTPAAMTLRTLSTSPSSQALKSSFLSLA